MITSHFSGKEPALVDGTRETSRNSAQKRSRGFLLASLANPNPHHYPRVLRARIASLRSKRFRGAPPSCCCSRPIFRAGKTPKTPFPSLFAPQKRLLRRLSHRSLLFRVIYTWIFENRVSNAKITTYSTTWQLKAIKHVQRPIKSRYLTPGSKLMVHRRILTSRNLRGFSHGILSYFEDRQSYR